MSRLGWLVALLFSIALASCGLGPMKSDALPVVNNFYREFQNGNTELASRYVCPEVQDSFLFKSGGLVKLLSPGKIRVNTHSLGSDIGRHYAIVYLESFDSRKTAVVEIEKIADVWKICPSAPEDLVPRTTR